MNSIHISDNVAQNIVDAIEDAVGDNIKEDIKNHKLITTNSKGSRIWDFINRNLLNCPNFEDCIVSETNRGSWKMVVLYDNFNKYVYTIMREQRFEWIQKNQHKRNKMHYVDMLTKQFNSDLISTYNQTSLFPKHTFSDESRLSKLVNNLLEDLGSNIAVVRNHVLILFDTNGYDLTSIRAVMITPELEIADNAEIDLSKFIRNSSVIVDEVDDPNSPVNSPSRGLKLKAKATQRKKTSAKIKENDEKSSTL